MSDTEPVPVDIGYKAVPSVELKALTPIQTYYQSLELSPYKTNGILRKTAEVVQKGDWNYSLTHFLDLAREQTSLSVVKIPQLELEKRLKSGIGTTAWSEEEYHGYIFVSEDFFDKGSDFSKLVSLQHQFKSLLLRKTGERSRPENLLSILDTDLAFLDFARNYGADPKDVEYLKKEYTSRKEKFLTERADLAKAA